MKERWVFMKGNFMGEVVGAISVLGNNSATAWIVVAGVRVWEQTYTSQNRFRNEAAYLAAEGLSQKIAEYGYRNINVYTDYSILSSLRKLSRNTVRNNPFAKTAQQIRNLHLKFENFQRSA